MEMMHWSSLLLGGKQQNKVLGTSFQLHLYICINNNLCGSWFCPLLLYVCFCSPFLLSESISIALTKKVIFRALLKEEWSWIYYFLLFCFQKKISQETAPRRNQRTVKGGNASIMQETSRLGVCHLPSSVECCGLYHDGAEDIYNKLQGHDSAAQPSPAQPSPAQPGPAPA